MRRSRLFGWTASGVIGSLMAVSLLISGCGTGPQNSVARDAGGAEASQPITPPIAAAWLYLSDDQAYKHIPATWSQINFKDVDVLNVGPAGVQSDGTFGLYNSEETGDLSVRFKWVMQQVRAQNPNIKIILSQWWPNAPDGGAGIWGSPLSELKDSDAIQKYTTSVGTFLKSYLGTSGGVDGYDIDYEGLNVVADTPTITKQIRDELNALSAANGGRRFYQTVSPSETSYLQGAVANLDFVNMQTYAGGVWLTPQDFTAIGLKPAQLLYGICPETQCPGKTLAQVEAAYTSNNLAGIHLWR